MSPIIKRIPGTDLCNVDIAGHVHIGYRQTPDTCHRVKRILEALRFRHSDERLDNRHLELNLLQRLDKAFQSESRRVESPQGLARALQYSGDLAPPQAL